MRILITSDWHKPQVNGIVTSITALEEELTKIGHDVRILTLNDKMNSEIQGNVYLLSSISAETVYSNARVSLSHNKNIYQDIVKWSPDIIHSQTEFSAFLWARRLKEDLRIPMVHTYHTDYSQYVHYFTPRLFRVDAAGRKVINRFVKTIIKYTDSLIVPTDKTLEQLQKFNIQKPIEVIPTGIDTEKFAIEKTIHLRQHYGIADDTTVLISVSRLGEEKNIDETIRCFAELLRQAQDNERLNNSYKLVIVGDGPAQDDLKKLVKKMKLKDDVVFTGMVSSENIASYYHMGDIFVSSSTSETQGLTYIEALASGLPLLCQKDEVLEKVLIDNLTGKFFNDSQSFIASLESIEEKRESMSIASQLHADNFSQKKFATKILQTYERIVQEYYTMKEK